MWFQVMYYKVTCKDNGCGLPHKDIPNMLGRVLSGSKCVACTFEKKLFILTEASLILHNGIT